MRRIKIGVVAAVCMLAITSCGNMNQVLSAISNGSVVDAITSVIGLDKVNAQGLIGTWNYSSPGCAFTSENLLAKAGGEVAAAQIEEKVVPYYQQVGISSSNTFITFGQDGKFSSKIAGTPFSGTYTYNQQNGEIALKTATETIKGNVTKTERGMGLMFDSKQMANLLKKEGKVSNMAAVQAVSQLAKSADGARVGFELTK